MASRANIGIAESNELADFEREALVNLVIRDIRTRARDLEGLGGKQ